MFFFFFPYFGLEEKRTWRVRKKEKKKEKEM